MTCYPTHTSHQPQPLYRSSFQLLKTHRAEASSNFVREEFIAHSYLMIKFQRQQNRILCVIVNSARCPPIRTFHVAFQIPYVYDFITKTCRKQAEVLQNQYNVNVQNIGKV